jgi:hypothetical protein
LVTVTVLTPSGSENAVDAVAGGFSASLTWAVNVLTLSTLVGVPEMTPVAACSFSPGVSEPCVIDQV